MRSRFMRLIVFFDLPVLTAIQRKDYRVFRKFLVKDGYLMMQESVYSKMVLAGASDDSEIDPKRRYKPLHGLVQVLKVTEKQYSGIVDIVGERKESSVVDTTDRLLVL